MEAQGPTPTPWTLPRHLEDLTFAAADIRYLSVDQVLMQGARKAARGIKVAVPHKWKTTITSVSLRTPRTLEPPANKIKGAISKPARPKPNPGLREEAEPEEDDSRLQRVDPRTGLT